MFPRLALLWLARPPDGAGDWPRRWGRMAPIIVLAVLLTAKPVLAIGRFSPAAFRFVTTIEDDGKSGGGGWQEASTGLNFVDTRPVIPRIWSCRVTVGVPLRTVALGRVTSEMAAEWSASIATDASKVVMYRQPEWLIAEFCVAFKTEMNRLFSRAHPDLGARVSSP